MHNILIKIHVWSNVIFTLIAIVLIFITIKGLVLKSAYKNYHNYLEKAYLVLLYMGLVFGILMYFFIKHDSDFGQISIEELQKRQSSKFWAIEHFSAMVFALLIAQIGRIFSIKAISDNQRFKYILFYYGSASAIILVSMLVYFYYKTH